MYTVKFLHHYITEPGLTPMDRLIHVLYTFKSEMHHSTSVKNPHQLQAIDHMRCLFQTWRETKTTTSPEPNAIPKVTRSDVTRPPQDLPAVYCVDLIQTRVSSLVVNHRTAEVQVTSDRPVTLGIVPFELSTSIYGSHAATYIVNSCVY